MIFRASSLYYQLYFGRGAEVLSEAMGAEEYKAFLSEFIGVNAVMLNFATYITLALSMAFLIKGKYSSAKYFLIAFPLFSILSYVNLSSKFDYVIPLSFSIDTLAILFYSIGVVIPLFFYIQKYQKRRDI